MSSTTPTCTDSQNTSPLFTAAAAGNTEQLKELLVGEAAQHNSQELNEEGETILLVAARNDRWDTVRWLVDSGLSNIQEKTKHGSLALHIAAGNTRTKTSCLSAVKWMVETLQMDPSHPNPSSVTPLLFAAQEGQFEIVRYLLEEQNASFRTERNKDGVTALLKAAYNGHFDIIEYLIQNGDDPQAADNDGETALLCAAAEGHFEVVKWFVTKGLSDPAKEMDKDDLTALLWAAYEGHLEIVKWLVKERHMCPSTQTDKDGRTAIILAACTGQQHVIEWLVDEGGSSLEERDEEQMTVLLTSALYGHLDLLKWLVKERGRDPHTERDIFGHTTLLAAIQDGYLPIVRWLVEEGVSDVRKEKGDRNMSAVLLAAAHGQLELLQWLLSTHPDQLSQSDKDGNTPLLLACAANRIEVAKWLVQEGLSDVENEKNLLSMNAPVAAATGSDRVELTDWLLTEGWYIQQSSGLVAKPGQSVRDQVEQKLQAEDLVLSASVTDMIAMSASQLTTLHLEKSGWLVREEFAPMASWTVKRHHTFPLPYRVMCCFAMWCFPKIELVSDLLAGIAAFWDQDAFSPRILLFTRTEPPTSPQPEY